MAASVVAGVRSAAPADALTRSSATLRLTQASVLAGEQVHVGVSVGPGQQRSFSLQERRGGAWVTIRRSWTQVDGRAGLTLSFATPGPRTLRVVAPRSGRYAGSSAAPSLVTVMSRSALTVSAAPAVTTPGHSVTIAGAVTPASAGRTVTLQRLSGASWLVMAATLTDSRGRYAFSPKTPGTTTYRGVVSARRLETGAASRPVTVTSIDLGDPVTKEIALELVSTAENATTSWRSSYSYLEDIGDGRGYTGGIVGWCSGTGDMLTLVARYAAMAPGNPLQKYLPRLQQIMAASYGSRPSLSRSLLGASFAADWAAAARTAAFQAAQRAERDRVYWDPALARAKADGLSPLGLYIYYDVLVNHGPGSDPESFGGIVAGVKARGHLAPAQGGDEVAYLTAVVDARDAVLRSWGDYQADGRSTIARRLLVSRNLALATPLHWTVYGDAYSITTPPSPKG